jgi:photosystem II stability/assembly factor-like uncharacterized protein
MAPLKWGLTVTRLEDLLREEFGRDDMPAGPGHDAMLTRVAKARRRRRAGGVAGCLVITGGLALAAVIFVAPNPTGTQPGGGPLPARVYLADPINTVFTDHEHGYVVQEGCARDNVTGVPVGAPTPDVHQRCQAQLLVTTDTGRTWQRRSLPGAPATKDAGVDLFPGHSLMFWVDDAGRLALGGWNRLYWTTVDGGVTWQESPVPREVGPTGSMATFGAGDRLTFLVAPPPHGVAARKPGTNPVVAATDGSFWMACAAGGCVWVTRDHGTTWQALSTIDSAGTVDWVATFDGRHLFASVRTATGTRLLRSTDAGATWVNVVGLAQPAASGLALPNGDLLLTLASDEGGMYRLPAGATALEKVTGAPMRSNALYLTGGVVVAALEAWDEHPDPDLEPVVWVSADDGTTWTAVPAPPV